MSELKNKSGCFVITSTAHARPGEGKEAITKTEALITICLFSVY
jgi:hypothetical protein